MKFSIVTPAYNMECWIAETIESVLSQRGDFEIEYVIVNDHSTDKTELIIKKYVDKINNSTYSIQCKGISMKYINKNKNGGMYNAINYGFSKATGDIYAWINADDVYQAGAFDTITKTINAFPEIEWLKGITSTIDEKSRAARKGKCKIYHQNWIHKGIYGQEAYFIEQDSTFWRSGLWGKTGPIPSHFRSAGDYWLWIQFAKYAPLWSVNFPISFFRKRKGQLSKNITKYKYEQKIARPKRELMAWKVRLFFSPQSRLVSIFPKLEQFFIWLYPKIFRHHMPVEYVAIENSQPVIKKTNSYIVV